MLGWVRWRVQCVHTVLHPLKGILPEIFEGCKPTTLGAFAARLGGEGVFWCDCGKSPLSILRCCRYRSDCAPGELGKVNTIRDLNTCRQRSHRG